MELDALDRLGACRDVLDAMVAGRWELDDAVLAHVELLIRQARRRLAARAITGWGKAA